MNEQSKVWMIIEAFILAAQCAVFAGCSQPLAMNDSQEQIVLQDDLDRTVSLKRPQSVAVLIGSFADLLKDAGGEDLISAAASDWREFDLSLDQAVDLGQVKSISTEALLNVQPDLVIASAKNESQKKMKEMLDQAEIPVVYYDVSDFDDYLRVLQQMSKLTGDAAAYQTNGIDQQEEIERILQDLPEKSLSVLALRETGKGIKALGSQGSVLGEMLESLQTDNIAKEQGMDTLSMEYILEQNPDEIFYVAQGKDLETARQMAQRLKSQPGWSELKAVKNGRFFVLDQKLYNLKPNSQWARALEDLKELVYA